MDRTAVFVDAGYLFAQGSEVIAGTKLRRSETNLDQIAVVNFLEGLATRLTGLPLLRIYWYDGTDSGPTAVHASLALRHNVKVRLGLVNAFGQQKGVDSLIVSDLINLSRRGAMVDAVLLTGDEDIRVGVQQAQETGVRVHLVGIAGTRNNQSTLLKQEADTVSELSKADVELFLSRATAPVPGPAMAPPAVTSVTSAIETMRKTAEHFATTLAQVDVERILKEASGKIPPDIDRALLLAASAAIGGSLVESQKRQLRAALADACKARP